MNNAFFSFLAELVTRLFSAKPKFFSVIQWVAFLAGGFSATVQYLQEVGTALPSWVAVAGNVNVVVGSVVALIIAQLPVKQGE
jgi:hypothetical protein